MGKTEGRWTHQDHAETIYTDLDENGDCRETKRRGRKNRRRKTTQAKSR